jgi:hypothetical protein
MGTTTVLQMKEFFKLRTMVNLNYSNLDEETQERLLTASKHDVERKYGAELEIYALQNQLDYQKLLEEEAQRNLYNFKIIFKI